MPEEQPEKLNLGGNGYNDQTGNFEIKASSRWGQATAGERANFQISATLVISDANGSVATVSGDSPVRKAGDPAPGSQDVPLEDATVAWDRNGGSYTGTVTVETTASFTKNGNAIGNSQTSRTDTGIQIGGRTDPTGGGG
jgi:hypothetical protein